MEASELLEIVSRDEDGKHQFKANLRNVDSLAAEIVAFSNSGGGQIFIGVSDDGQIAGLTRQDMGRLNQLLSNAASQHVKPPVNPQSENVSLPDGLVMIVTVPSGISKPYMDNNGAIWVKCGSDKRKATSREEIQRMYQNAGLIHGDEIPANGITIADLDYEYFKHFFEKEYGEAIENQENPLPIILQNMNIAKDSVMNIAGALLFAKRPQFRLPVFIVKAAYYPGRDISENNYIDSRDIDGKLADVFHKTLGFILDNIRHLQGSQTVNTTGEPEIPRIALEELLTNALIHRDYFISAPVRVFIFSDKVEIISPGHLPNNLTIENIISGNSNIRNPVLASFATKILPYRGLGNGVRRALKAYPDITFDNDKEGNLFKVTINRR